MNCALFGLGRVGLIHYNSIQNNKFLKLKYIYDVNIKNLQNKINQPQLLTDSIEEILYDSDIKFVIISTPILTHYELTKSCLQHMKHVLCENTISQKEGEIIECYNLAHKNKLVLLSVLNKRFDPNIIDMKFNYKLKNIGIVFNILIINHDNLLQNKNEDNIFDELAYYDIDYINWILNDKPISVYVTGNKTTNIIIIFEYSDGKIVNLNCSKVSNNFKHRVEIFGEQGTLKIEDNSELIHERLNQPYQNQLEYFINVITHKVKNKVKKDNNINCIKILHACKKSYQTSSKVTVKYGNGFRNYENVVEAIKNNYFRARKNQTLNFVKKMHQKYLKFNHKMKIEDVFSKLEHFIDVSDPDISLPNYYHGIQTAESIRKDGHPEWLQLVGLIHDIGKIIYLWGSDKDGTSINQQWAIVGDTFIVGCKIPDGIVFPEFNIHNSDTNHGVYNTKLGIYEENCGLDQVYCSWGHDEYLYQVLKHNQCPLPEEALYIIRFHSLYSYHKNDEYQYLTNKKDKEMFKWLKLFNQYDLYTKSDQIILSQESKDYYHKLIKKYLGKNELYF
jgi:inositol oxygenase